MSPLEQSRNVPLGRASKGSHSLLIGKLRSACGGFSQGRAPSLRAPEGSTGSAASNTIGARGNGSDLSEIKGDISTLPKGTFLSCCHTQRLAASREARMRRVQVIRTKLKNVARNLVRRRPEIFALARSQPGGFPDSRRTP